jgi:hypothetical protein
VSRGHSRRVRARRAQRSDNRRRHFTAQTPPRTVAAEQLADLARRARQQQGEAGP